MNSAIFSLIIYELTWSMVMYVLISRRAPNEKKICPSAYRVGEKMKFVFSLLALDAAEPIDVIARELKMSRSTVNKELAAVRRALKERLESEGYII